MNDRGSCLECRHLRMSHDISGWEAHCTVNSRKGRKITWQYGMDMDWCKRCVEESLKKAPAWCPVKTEKLEPCPICGKEVEIKWVCGRRGPMRWTRIRAERAWNDGRKQENA